MNDFSDIVVTFYIAFIVVSIFFLIYFIFKRIREKKNEDFEQRDY